MENNTMIGAKILSLRKAKNCTQAELGAYLNISYQAVSKWERGESCPDFETLSRIAQYFGVPISYFEKDYTDVVSASASAAAQPAVESEAEAGAMVGVCKDCGLVVHENEVGEKFPVLLCKDCVERRKQQAEEKLAAVQKVKERQEQQKKEDEEAKRRTIARRRKKGLIWGGIVGVLAIVFFLIGEAGALSVLYGAFIFTFVSQLFWDGAVVTCACAAMRIGSPGVIFDLSLDGLIFLVIAKLLFALIRFLVFLFSWLVCVFVAILISPFTFVPALLRINKGDMLGYDEIK